MSEHPDEFPALVAIVVRDAGNRWVVDRTIVEGLSTDEALMITQLAVDAAAQLHDSVSRRN